MTSSCEIQGALGLGETSDSYIPENIEGLPQNISGVAAGHYHSLAWDEEGRLFSWGSADKPLSLMSLPVSQQVYSWTITGFGHIMAIPIYLEDVKDRVLITDFFLCSWPGGILL